MAETAYFLKDEYQDRWARVQAAMRDRGYDTAVIWSRSGGTQDRCGDVLYLANYYSTASGQGLDTQLHTARAFSAVIMYQGEEPELHADEPWPRVDLIPTNRIEWHRNPVAGVVAALKRRAVGGRVALVGTDFFPMKYWKQLVDATPNIEWVPEDNLVQRIRRIKSPRELEAIRIGGETATCGLNRLMEGLLAGMPEAEAAGEAAREVVRRGGKIHMIACSHGDLIGHFVRNPLTGYSDSSPKHGDFVRGWLYGPMFEGYYLDPGRTAVVGGRPTDSQRELIEACADIVDAVIDAIGPGVPALDVAQIGHRMTKEFGGSQDQLTEKWPLFGHGVGLFFEEPVIGVDLSLPEDRFESGMVLGVEAFLAREGVGSAGFEQNVIVTDEGAELITQSPMLAW